MQTSQKKTILHDWVFEKKNQNFFKKSKFLQNIVDTLNVKEYLKLDLICHAEPNRGHLKAKEGFNYLNDSDFIMFYPVCELRNVWLCPQNL